MLIRNLLSDILNAGVFVKCLKEKISSKVDKSIHKLKQYHYVNLKNFKLVKLYLKSKYITH